MPHDVMTATEFVLTLPRGQTSLGRILERAADVPAKILGACEVRDGDSACYHVAVNSQPVFEPHFAEHYAGAYVTRPCLALLFEQEPGEGDDFLGPLRQGGIALEYTYGGPMPDGRVAILLQTTDNTAGLDLLDRLA